MRGYGQKDPLIEYKKEGFQLFNDLIDRIKEQTVQHLFMVQEYHEEEERERKRRVKVQRQVDMAARAVGRQEPVHRKEPFFEARGITITTIGNFGGFAYENPKIQESIDGVFIAQRKEEVNAALLKAQTDMNKKIEMEALAVAEKERTIAKGIADGKALLLAVAKEAAQDPVFIELRKLEVDEKRIEKWDGRYPTYMMSMGSNGSGGPQLLLNVPTPK